MSLLTLDLLRQHKRVRHAAAVVVRDKRATARAYQIFLHRRIARPGTLLGCAAAGIAFGLFRRKAGRESGGGLGSALTTLFWTARMLHTSSPTAKPEAPTAKPE
jgi:lipopolysaccharide export LptBFGC system permease protein LptF